MESSEGNGGYDPLTSRPESLGPTFRVVNPERVEVRAVGKNGNSQAPVVVGHRTEKHVIGSFLPKPRAVELASQINAQKGLIDKMFRPAKIIREKP